MALILTGPAVGYLFVGILGLGFLAAGVARFREGSYMAYYVGTIYTCLGGLLAATGFVGALA